jgi:RNA polymerase sigma factor (sigma-70 family)
MKTVIDRHPQIREVARDRAVLDDCALLERFVGLHDEGAFRALVIRHGPAVLRACRSILRDPFDVDDAFQATFVVLVRRAGSINDPERLDAWLIGVARRVSARTRRDSSRRRERQGHGTEMLAAEHPPSHAEPDLRDVLRQELDRLPVEYRLPLELCYLEGLTHEETADRLGWPLGTVKVRLVRSRRLLRERLDRRGAALGVLLLLLRPRHASAAVPADLVESTVRAMTTAARLTVAPGLPSVIVRPWKIPPWLRLGGNAGRCWALLAILAVTVIAAGAARSVERATLLDSEEYAAIPASLMDVLNVRCR